MFGQCISSLSSPFLCPRNEIIYSASVFLTNVAMTVDVCNLVTLKKPILLFSDMEATQIETRHTIG